MATLAASSNVLADAPGRLGGPQHQCGHHCLDVHALLACRGSLDACTSLSLWGMASRRQDSLVYPFAFEVEALALQLYLMRDEELHP